MAMIMKELSFIVNTSEVRPLFNYLLQQLHGESVEIEDLYIPQELHTLNGFLKDALNGDIDEVDIMADRTGFDLIYALTEVAEKGIWEQHKIDVSKMSITEYQFLEPETIRIFY